MEFLGVGVGDVVEVGKPFGEEPVDGGVERLAEVARGGGDGGNEEVRRCEGETGEDGEVVGFYYAVDGGGDAIGTGGLVGGVRGLEGSEDGCE